MTKMARMTTSKRLLPETRLIMLALFGIAISCAACLVTDTGEQCRLSQQASCDACINFFTSPRRITCEESEHGSTGCTTTEVPCIKHWQQQTCYPAGQGPYPEITTNYCANPGPWHDEQIDTTLQGVENGVPCPPNG